MSVESKELFEYIESQVTALARSMPGMYYSLKPYAELPDVTSWANLPEDRRRVSEALAACDLSGNVNFKELAPKRQAAAAAVVVVSMFRNAPRRQLKELYSKLMHEGPAVAGRYMMGALQRYESLVGFPKLEFVDFNISSGISHKVHYMNQVANAYSTAGQWLAEGSKCFFLLPTGEVKEKIEALSHSLTVPDYLKRRRLERSIEHARDDYEGGHLKPGGLEPRVRNAYLRYFCPTGLRSVINNVLAIHENYADYEVRVEYRDEPGFSDSSVWRHQRRISDGYNRGPRHAWPLISLRRGFFQCTVVQQAAILIEEWSRLWCGTQDHALDESDCVVLRKRNSHSEGPGRQAIDERFTWRLPGSDSHVVLRAPNPHAKKRQKAARPAMDDQPTWENAASYGYFLRDAFGPSAGRSGGMFTLPYRFRRRKNEVRRARIDTLG